MRLEKGYTIGQIAEKTHLSIHTLRYYEKEGIVPFIKRTESGIRIYEEEHIDWFKFLNCLRKTGMSITRLKDFSDLTLQGDETIDQRIQILEQQRKFIEGQIEILMSYIEMINFKTEMYSKQKKESKTPENQGKHTQKG
ncbi:MerR family transcriptional regulator [Sporolactobacillus laevolacticus]|uniref:MerR family transcriptional regulator n=1 Tax=Sporolactobacillus laevolacticus TaxID=33018 RepID=UPI0025B310B4|nr:MerR family transcriptional regulator [Sporolactobacillus laevolacticus]MDN3955549.1 MerR family transcriptional regulator [Sporolactobacillus laevolacticus]